MPAVAESPKVAKFCVTGVQIMKFSCQWNQYHGPLHRGGARRKAAPHVWVCPLHGRYACKDSVNPSLWTPVLGAAPKLSNESALTFFHRIHCRECQRMEELKRLEGQKREQEGDRGGPGSDSSMEGGSEAGGGSPRQPISPPTIVEEQSLQQAMDKNKESLKRKLMVRRSVTELMDQGILPPLKTPPSFAEQRKQLEMAKTSDLLRQKLKLRPNRESLVQHHILEDTKPSVDPSLQERQRQLKKARLQDSLNDRLANRPGPLELVKDNILHTDPLLTDAIKEGKILFTRTSEVDDPKRRHFQMDTDDSSASESAPSPQSSEASSEQSMQAGSPLPQIPTPPDIRPLLQKLSQQSPGQTFTFLPKTSSPITAQSFSIGLSPGGCSPTLPGSSKPTMTFIGSGSSLSAKERDRINKKKLQKQHKMPSKNKTIKFHEYKGPPTIAKQQQNLQSLCSVDTPYHILLQQQQLLLQLQLEAQQKKMKFILPAAAAAQAAAAAAAGSSTDASSNASLSPGSMFSTPMHSQAILSPTGTPSPATTPSPAPPSLFSPPLGTVIGNSPLGIPGSMPPLVAPLVAAGSGVNTIVTMSTVAAMSGLSNAVMATSCTPSPMIVSAHGHTQQHALAAIPHPLQTILQQQAFQQPHLIQAAISHMKHTLPVLQKVPTLAAPVSTPAIISAPVPKPAPPRKTPCQSPVRATPQVTQPAKASTTPSPSPELADKQPKIAQPKPFVMSPVIRPQAKQPQQPVQAKISAQTKTQAQAKVKREPHVTTVKKEPTTPVQHEATTKIKQEPMDTKPVKQEKTEKQKHNSGSSISSGRPQNINKLEDLKVADLKAECKKRNLPVSGPKPALLQRLESHAENIIKAVQSGEITLSSPTTTTPKSGGSSNNKKNGSGKKSAASAANKLTTTTTTSTSSSSVVSGLTSIFDSSSITSPPSVSSLSGNMASIINIKPLTPQGDDEVSMTHGSPTPAFSPDSMLDFGDSLISRTPRPLIAMSPDNMMEVSSPQTIINQQATKSQLSSSQTMPMMVDSQGCSRPPSVVPMDVDLASSLNSSHGNVNSSSKSLTAQSPRPTAKNNSSMNHSELTNSRPPSVQPMDQKSFGQPPTPQPATAPPHPPPAPPPPALSPGVTTQIITIRPQNPIQTQAPLQGASAQVRAHLVQRAQLKEQQQKAQKLQQQQNQQQKSGPGSAQPQMVKITMPPTQHGPVKGPAPPSQLTQPAVTQAQPSQPMAQTVVSVSQAVSQASLLQLQTTPIAAGPHLSAASSPPATSITQVVSQPQPATTSAQPQMQLTQSMHQQQLMQLQQQQHAAAQAQAQLQAAQQQLQAQSSAAQKLLQQMQVSMSQLPLGPVPSQTPVGQPQVISHEDLVKQQQRQIEELQQQLANSKSQLAEAQMCAQQQQDQLNVHISQAQAQIMGSMPSSPHDAMQTVTEQQQMVEQDVKLNITPALSPGDIFSMPEAQPPPQTMAQMMMQNMHQQSLLANASVAQQTQGTAPPKQSGAPQNLGQLPSLTPTSEQVKQVLNKKLTAGSSSLQSVIIPMQSAAMTTSYGKTNDIKPSAASMNSFLQSQAATLQQTLGLGQSKVYVTTLQHRGQPQLLITSTPQLLNSMQPPTTATGSTAAPAMITTPSSSMSSAGGKTPAPTTTIAINGVNHKASSVPSSPVGHTKLQRSATNPFFPNIPMKEPPKYDEAIKNKQNLLLQQPGAPPAPGPGLPLDGSAASPGEPLSVKSEAMDDVLEILIRHGELPASAVDDLPGTPAKDSAVADMGPLSSSSNSGGATVQISSPQQLVPSLSPLLASAVSAPALSPQVNGTIQIPGSSATGIIQMPNGYTLPASLAAALNSGSLVLTTSTLTPVTTSTTLHTHMTPGLLSLSNSVTTSPSHTLTSLASPNGMLGSLGSPTDSLLTSLASPSSSSTMTGYQGITSPAPSYSSAYSSATIRADASLPPRSISPSISSTSNADLSSALADQLPSTLADLQFMDWDTELPDNLLDSPSPADLDNTDMMIDNCVDTLTRPDSNHIDHLDSHGHGTDMHPSNSSEMADMLKLLNQHVPHASMSACDSIPGTAFSGSTNSFDSNLNTFDLNDTDVSAMNIEMSTEWLDELIPTSGLTPLTSNPPVSTFTADPILTPKPQDVYDLFSIDNDLML